MTLSQAQKEFGRIVSPSSDRFYSSSSQIIGSGSQSSIRLQLSPERSEGSSLVPNERLNEFDDDCDSVESFGSLPSLSSLLELPSSQGTALSPNNDYEPDITMDAWHYPNDDKRRKHNAWSPELEIIPKDNSETNLYKFALKSSEEVAKRGQSRLICSKCRVAML